GSEHGRVVVHADDGIQREIAREPRDAAHGAVRAPKVERNRGVARARREHLAPLGAHHDVDAELARGVEERLRAIAERGHEQQDARHSTCSRDYRRRSTGTWPISLTRRSTIAQGSSGGPGRPPVLLPTSTSQKYPRALGRWPVQPSRSCKLSGGW